MTLILKQDNTVQKLYAKVGNKNSLKMLKQLRNKKNFEKEYVLKSI